MLRVLILIWLLANAASAQPKRVLYVTHSAGFRHDSLPTSVEAMRQVAARSGLLEITSTEDVSMLNRETLRNFDAVFFFTSGELPITDQQKSDLLAFVRDGGGFGGAHSATDTLYTWPEYGELIGARFDGHPWVQPVRIDIEDTTHPATRHLAPGFTINEEIYQFRDFSRSRVRVLMTLDPSSVNRADGDFPLAWVRPYGTGRVFYTALGHFEDTWRDQRFQTTLQQALLWLTKQQDGDATPRPALAPVISPDGIGNAATLSPTISPGSLFTILGRDLTPGSTATADFPNFRYKLAGATVKINGTALPLLYAAPGQINAYLPSEITAGTYNIEITSAGRTVASAATGAVASPGIFTFTRSGRYFTVWATGLGPTQASQTVERPVATIAGTTVRLLYCGVAPGIPGLYQINFELPEDGTSGVIDLHFGTYETRLPF